MKNIKRIFAACFLIVLIGIFVNYQIDKSRNENLIKDFMEKIKILLVGNYKLDSVSYGDCGLDICYHLIISYSDDVSFVHFLSANKVEDWETRDFNTYQLKSYNGARDYSIYVNKNNRSIKYNYSEI